MHVNTMLKIDQSQDTTLVTCACTTRYSNERTFALITTQQRLQITCYMLHNLERLNPHAYNKVKSTEAVSYSSSNKNYFIEHITQHPMTNSVVIFQPLIYQYCLQLHFIVSTCHTYTIYIINLFSFLAFAIEPLWCR